MTSRERVLKAINHEEPDRLPIDFGSTVVTGITAIAYDELKKHLGISAGQIRVCDTQQQLAEVELPVLERFKVDLVALENTFGQNPEQWQPWRLPNGTDAFHPAGFNTEPDGTGGYLVKDSDGNVTWQMPKGALYFELNYHPPAHLTSIAEIEDLEYKQVTSPYSDQRLDALHERAKFLYENTDYALVFTFGGSTFEKGQKLRGWAQFLMDLAGNPDFTHALLDKVSEANLLNIKRLLDAVGDYIQIILMGDDLGMQTSPFLSLSMYREFVKPRHKVLYQYIHKNSKANVALHSCGSIYNYIPDMIEEGVEILNPVQTSAVDMDAARLKKEFGDRITFMGGGCDTQTVLHSATSEQVRKHIAERLEIFKPDGGFIFNPIHNIQPNVPPANIVAMFDAAYEYAGY